MMQPIIHGNNVADLDNYVTNEIGISSYQLMERASMAFCNWFLPIFADDVQVSVFCGPGNNGGDGLAIARILAQHRRNVSVFYVVDGSTSGSDDYRQNFSVLPQKVSKCVLEAGSFPEIPSGITIDGLFGVGINRPLTGLYAEIVAHINGTENAVIAIDIPSGLPADQLLSGIAIRASHTVSFQFPKLSLLFPEHATYVGELVVLDIGIEPDFFLPYKTRYFWCDVTDIPGMHKTFHRFSHKGDFGKVLLIGGSEGKMGSISLSTLAALRTGSGLVSTCVPQCGVAILQGHIKEGMVQVNAGEKSLKLPINIDGFDALGIGPGLGTSQDAVDLVSYTLRNFTNGVVIDADAINIIASNRSLYGFLRNCVITPHVKEFERLVGQCENHIERLEKAIQFSEEHECVLVLKGANTVVSLPDGRQVFNSSGTQYMASGGSGDALTGIIASFLGQGYSPENAAICGVFHHGLAGELASKTRLRGTIASDIVEAIPETFLKLTIL